MCSRTRDDRHLGMALIRPSKDDLSCKSSTQLIGGREGESGQALEQRGFPAGLISNYDKLLESALSCQEDVEMLLTWGRGISLLIPRTLN